MPWGRSGERVRWLAVVVTCATLTSGCLGPRPPKPLHEQYLAVWAGDADRKDSDFLALIDTDAESKTYGKVLRTIPVKSRGNEPHAVTPALRDDRRLFATGALSGRTFVFDLRQPLEGKLLRVDEPGEGRRFRTPLDVASLPSGGVVLACPDPLGFRGDAREILTAPGGLVELDANGQFRREIPAVEPTARGFIVAPTGVAVVPGEHALVVASRAHGYVPTATNERYPAISVQMWRSDRLAPWRTVVLEAGPRGEENLGPDTTRAFHRQDLVYVATHDGGALYASDSVGEKEPAFRLVFDFGAKALPSGAAVTPDDHWYVVALPGAHRVAALDVRDPWHPKMTSQVRLDRDPAGKARAGGPSGLAMSADGTRVAVSDYTVDLAGYRLDGDRRVHLLRLDPQTGQLRVDAAFRDEISGEEGIDFNRGKWPHGETGPARPHGVLFLAPAAPSDED
ncbi:MAG: hypothetical protein U0807_07085 [Candidatus Binatia bacterium]